MWNYGDYWDKVIPLMEGIHQVLVKQKIIHKRDGCMGYKQWFSNVEMQ